MKLNNSQKNKKFGRLSIIKKTFKHPVSYHVYYKVKCNCGSILIARFYDLKNGHTKSCGCLQKELATKNKKTHGMRYSPEYNSWRGMMERCYYKKHKGYFYYGGRGIKVCKSWFQFKNFIKDMGVKPTPQHSIDRINNNLGYSSKNCKWSSKSEQRKNQRKKINKKTI